MKYVLIVLDGMGDRGRYTPLESAKTPNMDLLVKQGKCGLLDIGYTKDVNSDRGYLTLLSSFSKEDYPGRGYLEALGVDLHPKQDDICIRGNFATLDKKGNLIDRRANRDETGLDYFCELIDEMEIDGIKFTVRKSAGHRVVILMEGNGLSDNINGNDPFKINVALPQVKAKDSHARFTASVLNKFVSRTHKILEKQEINRKRKFPANIVLIRNVGRKKDVDSFKMRFGLTGCCIAGIPIAKGVARYLGMDVMEVKGATGYPDTNLNGKINAVKRALKNHDLVFLHINGTDILSHEAKREEKKRFIEKIDAEIGKLMKSANMKKTVFIVTCDHRTNSLSSFTHYRHTDDPVPILVSGDNIKPDKIEKFSEHLCENGSLKLKGNDLIPELKFLSGRPKAL